MVSASLSPSPTTKKDTILVERSLRPCDRFYDTLSSTYPRVTKEEMQRYGITFVDKKSLFDTADMVTLHVPLTGETREFVGSEELEALEGGGYLLNTSRGQVVDEEALAESADLLKPVGVDVMQTEPPDPSNPLLSEPNVYVTPYIAGCTGGYATRSAKINARRIQRALDGKQPAKFLNPEVVD